MKAIKRIAITGPESTGKSDLARKLAEHYGTTWVREFARDYLEALERPYEEHDMLFIAKNQLLSEKKKMPQARKFLFCDTEPIVIKIWSEVKYERCHPWILEKIKQHPYDLYLLCDVDLPWEEDPLREHPDKRKYLFRLYYNELNNRNLPFYIVSGSGDQRLKNAIKAIENTF
ncbi:MAG: ATP-binding protein [Bacteroidales bacterium]